MNNLLFLARLFGVAAASFVTCYFIGAFIGYPPAAPADFAAWAGAVGTVGALIGTIVLATGQSREKQAAERSLAALVAAGVLPAISAAIGVSHRVEKALDEDISLCVTTNYPRYSKLLREACPWTAQSIVALSVLPNLAAYHLEHARAKISLATTDLNFAATIGPDDVPTDPSEYCKQVVSALQEARASLNIAKVECDAITPKHVVTA